MTDSISELADTIAVSWSHILSGGSTDKLAEQIEAAIHSTNTSLLDKIAKLEIREEWLLNHIEHIQDCFLERADGLYEYRGVGDVFAEALESPRINEPVNTSLLAERDLYKSRLDKVLLMDDLILDIEQWCGNGDLSYEEIVEKVEVACKAHKTPDWALVDDSVVIPIQELVDLQEAAKPNTSLLEENKRLREGLSFYSSKSDAWVCCPCGRPHNTIDTGEWIGPDDEMMRHEGEIADKALAERIKP